MFGSPHQNPNRRLCILTLWLASLASFAIAQQLPLKNYTTSDGLASNAINRIVKDSRGFLWFCTEDGLSRFDGYTFTNYSMEQGLPHRVITDFVETRSGEFWLSTYGGLVHFNPQGRPANRVINANDAESTTAMFTVVLPEDKDRLARAATVLLESQDGAFWCGTAKVLYRLERRNGRYELVNVPLEPEKEPKQYEIFALLEDQQKTLWIGASNGLLRRKPDGQVVQYIKREAINALFKDRQGRLWAGTRNSGFFRLSPDNPVSSPVLERFGRTEGLPTNWVSQFYEDTVGRFWIVGDNDLIEFFPQADRQKRRFQTYAPNSGLKNQNLTSLVEDASGNLWLGTSTAGTKRLAHNGFFTYGESEGLLSAFAIFEDAAGGLCFRAYVLGDQRPHVFDGTGSDLRRQKNAGAGFSRFGRFDGKRFEWFQPSIPFNFGFAPVQTAVQTSDGDWWVGSGAGLYRFPAAENFARIKTAPPLAVYGPQNGQPIQLVTKVFADSGDNVWVAGFGLARWDHGTQTWRDLDNTHNLPSLKTDGVRSFTEDRAGNIWLGFYTGVARFRAGQFTFFSTKDGIPPGAIENLHVDHQGRLWLTSARSGLLRLDDPAAEHPVFKLYTMAQGLSSNNTSALTEDRYGRIYVATARGLDQLEPDTGRFRHFTMADGLAQGNILAVHCDRNGTIWIGTHRGLSRFVPAPPEIAPPPPILIIGLTVAGEQRIVSARGETEIALPDLAPDRNQLQIEFVGLGFAPGDVLRYQYQLEGSGMDWGELSVQREVNFASLSPGQYRFRVRAVNADNVASVQPAVVVFRILRPVWQRWWFVSLALMLVGLLGTALYRYRVARLLELERMRTRIATDLHDDIGAGLSRVAILSEVVKRQVAGSSEQALPLLNEIADSARTLVQSMREIVWAIDPRGDELGSLISRVRQFASDVLDAQNINWDFEVPSELEQIRLDPDQRRQLFLIFKEALHNIAKHADCQHVSLNLKLVQQQLWGEIRDDGKGFALANSTDSHGLNNMRRRAEQIGGQLTVISSPGEGVSVKLLIPLKRQ